MALKIPISKYFQENDAFSIRMSDNDIFTFRFLKQSLKVFYPVACLLSPKAAQLLQSNPPICSFNLPKNQFYIKPQEIRNSFLSLLQGKPLQINENNFEDFHEIFHFFENPSFDSFFPQCPSSPTDFYLPLASLKYTNIPFSDSLMFRHQTLPDFQIPKSFFHFFWANESFINLFDPTKANISSSQIEDGIKFLKILLSGEITRISPSIKEFLVSTNFNPELLREIEKFALPAGCRVRKDFFKSRPQVKTITPVLSSSFSSLLVPSTTVSTPSAKNDPQPCSRKSQTSMQSCSPDISASQVTFQPSSSFNQIQQQIPNASSNSLQSPHIQEPEVKSSQERELQLPGTCQSKAEIDLFNQEENFSKQDNHNAENQSASIEKEHLVHSLTSQIEQLTKELS